MADNEYDFSFSGLKSAVLNHINVAKMKGEELVVEDIAASFQQAVVDVLVDHTMDAVKKTGLKKMAIAGGVSSNTAIRKAFEDKCRENNIEFYKPEPIHCTDNAVMIASAGYYEFKAGVRHGWDLNAIPNMKLGERKY